MPAELATLILLVILGLRRTQLLEVILTAQ